MSDNVRFVVLLVGSLLFYGGVGAIVQAILRGLGA